MIGIDSIGLPTTVLFTPLAGMIGPWLLKITIFLGILIIISHILTRLLKTLL